MNPLRLSWRTECGELIGCWIETGVTEKYAAVLTEWGATTLDQTRWSLGQTLPQVSLAPELPTADYPTLW